MSKTGKSLLQEAIADADVIKKTALANAKAALAETFTPQLKSMLNAKLSEELDDMSDEDEDEVHEGEENSRFFDPEDEVSLDEDEDLEDSDDEQSEDESFDDLDHETEEDHHEPDGDEDLDLDLDIEDDTQDSGEDLDVDLDIEDDTPDEDEDIDLDEIIGEEEDMEDSDEPIEEIKAELAEAYKVIKYLRAQINETNLLNTKLLYASKIFKEHALTEKQKLSIIENFDKAKNVNEAKLIYTTAVQAIRQFAAPSRTSSIKESFASKSVKSTKPSNKEVITESDAIAKRFQKLAGLIKG